ncbi:MAG TPA: diacylglycerol kinase family protein [Anaerolineales bacterium]|nr:diacylglycerol kinase family protein [Anaerolineales bacterium]
MTRMKVIFNPHADRGRAWDTASYLQSLIERHGGADWAATEYPRHATELAREAARQGYDVVAALGGDGTVHEIVNGLMAVPERDRPVMGIIPVGSGNDFCNNIGLPKDPEQAMHRLFHGAPRTFDIGRITDGSGRAEFWDNTLGIGFDATVTIYSYQITRLQGFSMYLWAVIQTILRNHDAPSMSIETDQEAFQKDTLMLTVCNGPREGGGFHVAPGATPDDGVFNYAHIGKVSRLMMFRLIPEVMNGTHGRFPQVRLGTCRQLKVTSAKPVTIHADGEIFAGFSTDVTQLTVDLLPRALHVVV